MSSVPVLRATSILFAVIGTAGLATNFVLTARLRVVERLLGGLDRLYVLHRRLAVASLSAFVVHGALVAAAIGADGWRIHALGWKLATGAVVLAGLGAGIAVSMFAKSRMSHEAFVRVQRAFGGAFALGAVHALILPGRAHVPVSVRVLLVALFGVGGAAFVYRVVLGRVAVPRLEYRVETVDRLDDTVAHVVLRPVEAPLRFRCGQFAFLSFVGTELTAEAHPFSITSAPTDEHLSFMVKALGDWTGAVQLLGPGVRARIEGPYGGFWQAGADNPRQIWIAGGVGVAPFLSMARSLRPEPRQIDLYYCTEGPEHAHLIDELFAIADRNPSLRVVPIRKRSLGHIDVDDIEGASIDIVHKEIYICGPPVMMHNLERQFIAFGVPRSHIHFEDFSFM